jgi:hypothetical protein
MTLSIHTVAGRLTPAAPFDFAQTLRFAEDFTPARFKELATRYGNTSGYWAFYLRTGAGANAPLGISHVEPPPIIRRGSPRSMVNARRNARTCPR